MEKKIGPMDGIGNTPLIKIEKLAGPDSADIYVKFEGANPTGSMKDRMSLSMIEGAERRGELKEGGTVVEYTGGSTGSSLAMVCAKKGYYSDPANNCCGTAACEKYFRRRYQRKT